MKPAACNLQPIKNKKAFTLTELLVSMIVSAILILMVGVLSSIANSSYNKLSKQQEIYNDVAYGFKLMQNRVRGAQSSVNKVTNADAKWANQEKLIADNEAFGLYNTAGTQWDFVHLPDKTKETNASDREVIFSVPAVNASCTGNVNCLSWSVTCDPDCSNPKLIKVAMTGKKNKIPFDLKTTIFRRNQ